MPQVSRAQLVLVELAGAAVLGGLAGSGVWPYLGGAAAALLAAAALVPVRRRWLYQLAVSWLRLIRRRRRTGRRPGLAALLGQYSVEAVPGGDHGSEIGVVRSGPVWNLPLVLGLDGVFNDDATVPVRLLAELLQVEDVPLASVRLFTLMTPAQVPAHAPAGPGAPLIPLAARYCLLTLDTRRAAEAIGDRGGTRAAVQQILRRCAVHAEQLLSTAGLSVRRLDAAGVESLFATWLGPASVASGRRAEQTVESWSNVRVAGTWSTTFAVSGTGDDLADRVARLAAAAPTAVAATTLVLEPEQDGRGLRAGVLMRLSSPDTAAREDAAQSLGLLAQAYDLTVQPLDGEQGELLRATTPVGVGAADVAPGTAGVRFGEAATIAAPRSGVQLGVGEGGPVSLRLFRLTGTRIATVSALLPAQLIALRVAAAGTPVQVVTSRPQFWEPLLPRELGAQIVPAVEHLQPPGGPSLLVDDRPAQARGSAELHPWQCRLDVRTDWTRHELPSFAYTDLAIFGAVAPELTGAVASAFGLPPYLTDRVADLDTGTAALMRRGRLEVVALDPTPAERQLLEAASGAVRVAAPIWR